jgi:hypothetical protein
MGVIISEVPFINQSPPSFHFAFLANSGRQHDLYLSLPSTLTRKKKKRKKDLVSLSPPRVAASQQVPAQGTTMQAQIKAR